MRKLNNGEIGFRILDILMMWKSGIAIELKQY